MVGPTAGSTGVFGRREGKKRNEGGKERWGRNKRSREVEAEVAVAVAVAVEGGLSEKLPRGEGRDSGSIFSFKCPKDKK